MAAAFATAFDRGGDPQLLVDDDGRVAAINQAVRHRFALDGAPGAGARVEDLLPAAVDSGAAWRQVWADLHERSHDRARLRLAAGVFEVSVVAGPPGALNVLTLRDVEPPRDSREGILRAVADSSHDALLSLDTDGCVNAVSARASLVLGYSERALLGRPLSTVVVEPRRGELDALVRRALDGADVFQHDTQSRRRDGSVTDITVNLAPLRRHSDDAITGVSVIIQDITGRKQLERELRHHSERDALTGLYNRRHFEIEVHRTARLGERHGHGGAVILLDVDRFKAINDTHGHRGGDDVLRALAGALAGSIRDSDVAARLGGDEFAVLLPNVDRAGAIAAAEKVLIATRDVLRRWQSSVSVGAAWFGPGATSRPELTVEAADRALYRAKAAGGDVLDVADIAQ